MRGRTTRVRQGGRMRSLATTVAAALLLPWGPSGIAMAEEGTDPKTTRASAPRDETDVEAVDQAEQISGEAVDLPPVVVYVPRSRGGARITAGAGTRTRSSDVKVAVLAPNDHVALTTRAQPTLYWFVSQDTDMRIDLTVVDEDSIDPMLEMTVPGPIRAGIHAFDLEKAGIVLAPEKTYRWYVTLVHDANRRSNDAVAGGAIERTIVSGDLERSLRAAPFAYAPYALSGIWYDAMDELLVALEKDPDNERLRMQRAALLEQAELTEVAVYTVRAGP